MTPDKTAPKPATKISANVKRDRANEDKLSLMGWTTLQVWECQVSRKLPTVLAMIAKAVGW